MDDINPEDLISQLKTLPADSKKLERVAAQHPEISREDLEDFVIKQSSKLIQDSSEMIDNMKEVVHHLPEADNMSALSELVKASTGALETLNKIVMQDKKSKTTIKTKEMDIESKKELQQSDQSHSLTMSREEVISKLLKDSKDIIDVTSQSKAPDQLSTC